MSSGYRDRVWRVLNHIHDNPAADLSLDALCEVAAMSRFHWHRVFRAMTGETCAEAVRRIRVFRAACLLERADLTIDEVARATGFTGRHSLSRVFRDHYGVTPGQFRKTGGAGRLTHKLREGSDLMFDVEINDMAAMRVAGVPHKGDYQKIGLAFDKASSVATSQNLWPQVLAMAGVYFDDPGAVAEDDLRSFAGFGLASGTAVPEGLDSYEIPAGPCAVLRLKGPYSGLRAAYDYLYGDWLAQSGRDPADRPSYEVYLNSPMDTAPEDLLTEVCLPLKP
ncbi:MAG: AraC family transcriptional regulator [Rhodobacteraceae bacterium]|nr:MAG: AraC family transcriptional regulator [Paracoccaceae bacterium]